MIGCGFPLSEIERLSRPTPLLLCVLDLQIGTWAACRVVDSGSCPLSQQPNCCFGGQRPGAGPRCVAVQQQQRQQ